MKKQQYGYVLLISAIMVSAALLTVALTASLGSFYLRSNESDFINKRQSFFLALSCLDKARLNLAQGPGNPLIANVAVADKNCQINSINLDQPAVGQISIVCSGTVNKATTILQFIIDGQDLSLISWKELKLT